MISTAFEITTDMMRTGFLKSKIALSNEGDVQNLQIDTFSLLDAGAVALVVPKTNNDKHHRPIGGLIFQPSSVHWRKPVIAYEEEISRRNDLDHKQKKKRLSDHLRKLRKSEGFSVEIEPLHALDFRQWYSVYERAIVEGKDGWGMRGLPSDFDKSTENVSLAAPDERLGVFLLDNSSGNIAGGYVVELLPKDSLAKIRAVAFDPSPEFLKCHLSYRGLDELSKLAESMGLKFLSYGHDPNFYGEFINPGLARFKLASGFRPELWRASGQPEFYIAQRFLGILDPSAFREPIITFGYTSEDSDLALFYYGRLPDDFPKPNNLSFHEISILS